MMTDAKKTKAIVTAEIRKSDGACIARDLFATYPVRLHLTSRPNNDNATSFSKSEKSETDHKQKALCCYVLGYGGGLISGDAINLEFNVKPYASLVVTSQSTSKAFKAVPNRVATTVQTNATVGHGGLLVLVPQPTQCFAESKFTQETKVSLELTKYEEKLNSDTSSSNFHDSSLLLVDWYTGGRRNLDNGNWKLDSFSSTTSISYREEQNTTSADCLAFHDVTSLSGGSTLQRHMQDFNLVCMVVLIGSRVKPISQHLLDKFSSRHTFFDDYDESSDKKTSARSANKASTPKFSARNFIRGEGLNGEDGMLISCGSFPIPSVRGHEGVILRIASKTIEQAAFFLSKHVGTLNGELQDDPFLEILVSRQAVQTQMPNLPPDSASKNKVNQKLFSYDLVRHSFGRTQQFRDTQQSPIKVEKVSPTSIYQIVDASTPTGGFAHSNTVEVAHQLHFIDESSFFSTSNRLQMHVWEVMLQTCTSLLPFLLSSCKIFYNYRSIDDCDPLVAKWEALDAMLSATMTSHVSRRASVAQGSGMIRAFMKIFPQIIFPLKRIKKSILQASIVEKCDLNLFGVCGHAATCFGAVCGLLGIDLRISCSMFLYTSTRDMVNAAVRMNLAGPLEAGGMINKICSHLEKILDLVIMKHLNNANRKKEKNMDIEAIHQISPLIEVLSNAHDRLYTRLFNS